MGLQLAQIRLSDFVTPGALRLRWLLQSFCLYSAAPITVPLKVPSWHPALHRGAQAQP